MKTSDATTTTPRTNARNRFDRFEWAGAFGDAGTLIPFVLAYISVVRMDPSGVLLGLGVAMLASGLYYATPFPVQPMKAIGAVAAAQAAPIAITPAAVCGAGLITGAIWLLLGATGAAKRILAWVSPAVAAGIVLGLGLGLALEGARMMSGDWLFAGAALVGTLLLLARPSVPAMPLLLPAGVAVALYQDPALLDALRRIEPEIRLPTFAPARLTWNDLLAGALLLALPQLPLTLGNAVIAVTREHNRLFPARPVTERRVMLSTGIMNLGGAALGGIPMCHGAGGLAGHVRFGARTGGALVILGVLLLVLALFFSGSVATLFRMFPPPILGVILFLAGVQLAAGVEGFGRARDQRFVIVVTAALGLWNVGIGFVAGMALDYGLRRRLVRS